MISIARGIPSIGLSNRQFQTPTLPLPPAVPTLADEVERLLQRFSSLETIVERKADNDTLRSAIRMSPEAILLEAKDVGVLGTFTVADILSEHNGTTSGAVPLAITQIKGDFIRTGTLLSNNWSAGAGSAYSLNDGTFTLGGSSAPKLSWNGSTLTVQGSIVAGSVVAGSVTVNGVALGTTTSNASIGKAISDALTISGTTILRGVIQPDTSGAIRVGSITWNPATGVLTGGTGIALTQWGFIGASAGQATFSIDTATGSPIYKGSLDVGGSAIIRGNTASIGGWGAAALYVDGQSKNIQGAVIYSNVATALTLRSNGYCLDVASANGRAAGFSAGTSSEPGVTMMNWDGLGAQIQGVTGLTVAAFTSAEAALTVGTGKIIKPRVTGHRIRIWATADPDQYEYQFM